MRESVRVQRQPRGRASMSPGARVAPAAHPAADPILGLQRTIGNRAVSRRLARPQVQRQAAGSAFDSLGYGAKDSSGSAVKITRPRQVLQEYGITCYGTSVMYMLQSYGLVPPNMSREEFEHAFTPLNPYGRSASPPAAKSGVIKVNGVEQPGAAPIDLITEALEGTPARKRPTSIKSELITATEATLRGADWGGFTVADIMRHMPAILDRFQKQSEKKGYEFMKAALPASGTAYTAAAKEKWTDGSNELIAGTIDASYFKGGNTMMVAVDYKFPPSGSILHWAVIVREKEATVTIGGHSYHLYPADDPHWQQVYVVAPLLWKADADALKAAGFKKQDGALAYNGRRVHMMVKGSAFRRSGVK